MAATGLRQRKKERTAGAITETALDMIRKRGYLNVTVEAVVRELDISQPTFYNYYSSLDDVLRKTARRIMDAWGRASSEKAFPSASVRSILRAKYRKLAEAMTADPDLWRAIFQANALNPYNYKYNFERELDPELEKVQQAIIDRGRKNGEINRGYNAEFLSRNLNAMQFSIAMDWCMGDRKESLRRRLDKGLEFFFRGAGGR